MSTDNYNFEVICTEEELIRIKDEWNELFATAKSSFFLSFNYCFASWQHVQKHLDRKLFIVIGRENGKLFLVWPLVRYKNRRLWTTIRPLSSFSSQMSDILIDTDTIFYNRQTVNAVWKYMCRRSRAHNCNFTFVKEGTPFFEFLEESSVAGKECDNVPYLVNTKTETWEEYYHSLGGSHRRSMIRRKKLLTQDGKNLTFKIIENQAEAHDMLDWLIEHKRAWINKVKKVDHDLYSQHFKDLMYDLTFNNKGLHVFTVFALLLDDIPISVKIVAKSQLHINRVMATYDLAYSKSSPGMILDEFINKWAFDQGLDIHFGAGLEESKMVWSRRNTLQINSYQISNNIWGKIGFKAWKVLKDFKERNIKRKEQIK